MHLPSGSIDGFNACPQLKSSQTPCVSGVKARLPGTEWGAKSRGSQTRLSAKRGRLAKAGKAAKRKSAGKNQSRIGDRFFSLVAILNGGDFTGDRGKSRGVCTRPPAMQRPASSGLWGNGGGCDGSGRRCESGLFTSAGRRPRLRRQGSPAVRPVPVPGRAARTFRRGCPPAVSWLRRAVRLRLAAGGAPSSRDA